MFSAKISEEKFSNLRKRVVPVFLEKANKLSTSADKRFRDFVSKSVLITWSDQEEDKLKNLTRIKYSLPKKRSQPTETKQSSSSPGKRQVEHCDTSGSLKDLDDTKNNGTKVIPRDKLGTLGSVDFNHNPYNMPYFKGK